MDKPYNALRRAKYGLMAYNVNDEYVGKAIEKYGEYSEHELGAILQFLREDSVVLEAGANIGAMTVPLAKHCHQGRVLAFEPQIHVFHLLCANVALNSLKNVKPFFAAIGKTCGQIEVPYMDPEVPANFGGLELRGNGQPAPLLTVDVLKLPRLDLLKADVEGMEQDVLLGAADTISRCRPILWIEIDREAEAKLAIGTAKYLGYRCFAVVSPLFNPNNYAECSEDLWPGVGSVNAICMPDGTAIPGLREL